MPGVRLIPIDRDGTAADARDELAEPMSAAMRKTAEHYRRSGFEPPWIGYLALADPANVVGLCSFKSAPNDHRVEIAYFTLPAFEGQGFATAMATELVAVAHRTDPRVQITAQTLPQRNASHRVLEKLGFHHAATLEHPEDGTVWEWRMMETGMESCRAALDPAVDVGTIQ
jgi:RimJ/RimL family protein N-acetyltransferase